MRKEISELRKKEIQMNERLDVGRVETTKPPPYASVVDMQDNKHPLVVAHCEQQQLFNLNLHRGDPNNVIITNGNVVEFNGYSTVAAPLAVVTRGVKVYYVVTFEGKVGGNSYIGWVTSKFKQDDEYGHVVGRYAHSRGFNAQGGIKGFSC